MQVFRFPDLGEGLHEAQIVEWHVAEGDTVAADDPLLAVETDKAVTEVPAPWKGRIVKLCAAVGDTIKVGDEVVRYEGTRAGALAPEQAAARPVATPPLEPSPEVTGRAGRVRAMPAVRMLAEALGLDLSQVEGSGPEGLVLARDLAVAVRSAGPGARQGVEVESSGWEALVGPRRTMARRMELSHREVAATTVHEEADVSGWGTDEDVTVRLIAALVRAAAAEPSLNGWFDAARGRKLMREVHLGLAVDTADGLLVPVLRDAGAHDAAGLRRELDRLVRGARERTLSAHELDGATITLTNYGMMAGLHATPVVVPPQIAILGSGRMGERLVPEASGFRRARIMPLSLTYDHRCITGGEAARFIKAVIAALEGRA